MIAFFSRVEVTSFLKALFSNNLHRYLLNIYKRSDRTKSLPPSFHVHRQQKRQFRS